MSDAYAKAGVDIDAGEALVEAIKPAAAATRRPGADAALGGFGGVFDLKAAGFNDPLLVSGTDGVGTKLLVAVETGQGGRAGANFFPWGPKGKPNLWGPGGFAIQNRSPHV